MTPAEARLRAREMFRALSKISPRVGPTDFPSRGGHRDNPEFFERAAVLADVVLQSDRPEVGEALALAVNGRVTPWSGRFAHLGVGAALPYGTEGTELKNAVDQAGDVLFPPRRGRCLPNREALWGLVSGVHGTGPEGKRAMRGIWSTLREACTPGPGGKMSHAKAMSLADRALHGHNVEGARYYLRGQRIATFLYVNMGDTYDATICLVVSWNGRYVWRYEVSTWGDLVEATERRFPNGEWVS